MAVPMFLNSSYHVYHAAAVVDMLGTAGDTHGLSVIYNALSGQTPAWTLTDNRDGTPPTVTAESPHDADGRFFKMVFTDIAGSSDLKMSMALTDQNASPVTGTTPAWNVRVNAPAGAAWDVWVFSGQYHFCIEFYFGTQLPEFFKAGITDFTPEAQTQNTHYVYGQGSRTTADSLSYNDSASAWMIDNVTPVNTSRCGGPQGLGSSCDGQSTPGGYCRFVPVEYWCTATGANTRTWAGRGYQHIYAPYPNYYGQIFPNRSRVTIPIDLGTTGIFQVACPVAGGYLYHKIAYRVG